MLRLLTILFALLALIPALSAARAQDPVRQGRMLVKEFCARCHSIGRRGRSPHADAPPLRYMGRTYDLDEFPRTLERGISSNHPDMPEFKFSEENARAVRDYLRTIQQ
jgi:mono/diheme cytochrome c family protein